MKQAITALFCGIIFGLGLAIGGMTDPNKVLNFMDIFGEWDPTLLIVFCAAVTTTLISFRFVLKMPHPLFDARFNLPTAKSVDSPLIIGATCFGIGWGLLGFCPGPAIVSILMGSAGLIFALSMLCGHFIADKIQSRKQ